MFGLIPRLYYNTENHIKPYVRHRLQKKKNTQALQSITYEIGKNNCNKIFLCKNIKFL